MCLHLRNRRRHEGFGDEAPYDDADDYRPDLRSAFVEGDEIGAGDQVADIGKTFAGKFFSGPLRASATP